MRQTTAALILASTILLAGCAGKSAAGGSGGVPPPGDVPDIVATSTTGGIHGFVVDDRIVPIKGASVSVMPGNHNLTTNAAGAFAISGLEAGTYFVKASHPLYNAIQQSVDVVAGVEDPKDVKFQLTRLIAATPFTEILKYDGFIVCSLNAVTPVGGVLSEECGEGVGVPCVQPPIPCGRTGGQSNNNVQYDFRISSAGIKTMIIEQVWEPTSDAGKGLYTPVSTDWTCDPVCGGNTFLTMEGESPLLGRVDADALDKLNLTPSTTNVTAFTWASPASNPIGVVLNQQYQLFVTNFYFLPAPQGWSLAKGDTAPF